MTFLSDMVIVRHKKTNLLYSTEDGIKYKNLITDVEGEVPNDVAQKIFAINLDATELLNNNPNIEALIKKMQLKIEVP